MFLQSCAGEIELLPALPKAWPNGSIKGLRARGGFELDVQWNDGKLTNVTVHSLVSGSCRLRHGEVTRDLNLTNGQSVRWDGTL
jgi:alpha-L-fucosidase 2